MKTNILRLIFYAMTYVLAINVNAQSPYSLSPDWYFGQGGRLTFTNGNYPVSGAPSTGSMLTNTSNGPEASTSICFTDGSVALYTNTLQVYNGSNSAGWWDYTTDLTAAPYQTCAGSATGGGIAFPDPASPTNAFYLITCNDMTGGSCTNKGVNRYRYTGTGTTVAYNAGPTLMASTGFASEAVTGCTDGTGGYWVVVHDQSTNNTFRVWHFTSGGISGPTDYTVGAAVSNTSGTQSYLKISPCQDKIAYHSGGILVVHSFNRTTGVVGAELRRISPASYGVGLEFSPDGNRVYYSGQGSLVSWVNVGTGATGSVAGSASWSLQLGPDGKIYTSPGGSTSTVGVISNPNGAASYSTLSLPGGATIFRGLSNMVWLTPQTPDFTTTISSCSVDFTHVFKNYFNTNVAVDNTTFNWTFGDASSSTTVAPNHVYSGSGTYSVSLTFQDNTCHHTWTKTANVVVSCPMPVDWLNIDANAKGSKVSVTWSTAREINNSHFVIERSSDGIHYSPIGQTPASGNTNSVSSYEFIDESPLVGANYYRVTQYDFDQHFSTSNAVNVSMNENIFIDVNPNPSTNQFKVNVTGDDTWSISVVDILGRVVYSQSNVTYNSLTFGEDLAKGAYVLQVIHGDKVFNKKLIKE